MEWMKYKIMLRTPEGLTPATAWGDSSFNSLGEARDACYKMCLLYAASEYVIVDASTDETVYDPRAGLAKQE